MLSVEEAQKLLPTVFPVIKVISSSDSGEKFIFLVQLDDPAEPPVYLSVNKTTREVRDYSIFTDKR